MALPSVPARVTPWTRFTAKAEQVGAAVMRASSDAAAATVLREAAARFVCTPSVAQRFPRVAETGQPLPASDTAPGPRGLNRAEQLGAAAELAELGEVVSVARFAVAETGSVALDEPPVERAACFLAERLWLLVLESDIVDDLDHAVQRMQDLVRGGARHPLLMTGPSRTADIERTLTVGVHGPRALVIVVVGTA